jgi:hypothetical protein
MLNLTSCFMLYDLPHIYYPDCRFKNQTTGPGLPLNGVDLSSADLEYFPDVQGVAGAVVAGPARPPLPR